MALPTSSALEAAARAYDVEEAALTFVREAANAVYAFTLGGQPYILRMTPAAERSINQIQGELAWIDFLAGRGAGVPAPRRTQAGQLVETVGDDTERFHVAVFARAPGEHPEGELLTAPVFQAIGRTLGRMHRLTQSYQPATLALRRPHWHELNGFDLETQLPADQPVIQEGWQTMQEFLWGLPTTPEVYGLIHADPEPGNLLLDEGSRLTLIDFDDCCYHWYVFDLAVALFHGVLSVETDDQAGFARAAWRALRKGYTEEQSLTPEWEAFMPQFLRLRIFQDYAFHVKLLAGGHPAEWLPWMVEYQRGLLESDGPVLEVDFPT